MSNEEPPQSAELASAYLDGELDATQRAAATADPEVMAVVDSFTRVRAALGDVDPVVAGAKTAAIAAALAEFDAIHAPQTTDANHAVIPLRSRRLRAYRVLTGAAAAAIIGVVAIAALDSGGSDQQDSSAIATDLPAADLPQIKIAAGDVEAASEAAPGDTASAGGAEDSATGAVTVIDSTEALAEFAAIVEGADATTAAPAATSNAPAPNDGVATAASGGYASASCLTPDQSVLGPIIFKGTPALAIRDIAAGSLQAIASDDCRLLVEVP